MVRVMMASRSVRRVAILPVPADPCLTHTKNMSALFPHLYAGVHGASPPGGNDPPTGLCHGSESGRLSETEDRMLPGNQCPGT
jgi:hypothetical protein